MLNLIEKYNELTKSESELEELAEITLLATESLINTIVEEGKQNEQWFLDYLDNLNKLSVSY
jgi:hypothetical protein